MGKALSSTFHTLRFVAFACNVVSLYSLPLYHTLPCAGALYGGQNTCYQGASDILVPKVRYLSTKLYFSISASYTSRFKRADACC